jgi:hypothetical protein
MCLSTPFHVVLWGFNGKVYITNTTVYRSGCPQPLGCSLRSSGNDLCIGHVLESMGHVSERERNQYPPIFGRLIIINIWLLNWYALLRKMCPLPASQSIDIRVIIYRSKSEYTRVFLSTSRKGSLKCLLPDGSPSIRTSLRFSALITGESKLASLLV